MRPLQAGGNDLDSLWVALVSPPPLRGALRYLQAWGGLFFSFSVLQSMASLLSMHQVTAAVPAPQLGPLGSLDAWSQWSRQPCPASCVLLSGLEESRSKFRHSEGLTCAGPHSHVSGRTERASVATPQPQETCFQMPPPPDRACTVPPECLLPNHFPLLCLKSLSGLPYHPGKPTGLFTLSTAVQPQSGESRQVTDLHMRCGNLVSQLEEVRKDCKNWTWESSRHTHTLPRRLLTSVENQERIAAEAHSAAATPCLV